MSRSSASPRSAPLPAPLSYQQERLWSLDRLDPGTVEYNVPLALRLRGALDVRALTASLGELVARHEALRTVFPREGDEPAQRVVEPQPFALPLDDLSGLPEGERDAGLRRLGREEAAGAFDLARAPLVRGRLVRLAERDHVLLLTVHHIACDGWSVGLLVDELAQLLEARASGRPSPLAPVERRYADFAAWQRRWVEGDRAREQLDFWRERLAGMPPLELETDRPRPPVRSARGAGRDFRLEPPLVAELEALGRREGATLFMTLLAAFALLLARHSGQEDVGVGTAVANRPSAEFEKVVGFFANRVVLRCDLSGEPTFRELLRRVREVALDAFERHDLPYDRLAAELEPQPDPSRTPLMQAMLVLHGAGGQRIALPGLDVEALPLEVVAAKVDLELSASRAGDGSLVGALGYSTDLFDPPTVERMWHRYERLLAAVLAAPGARLYEIEM
jgi:hypothetical protein